jgi:hypothetical protein
VNVRANFAWAGIVSGPGAWAISTQLNYALASWPCSGQQDATGWIALALVAIATIGGFFSWRALDWVTAEPALVAWTRNSGRLIAFLGVALAALFALVIAMQGFAVVVFTGCEI